MPEQDQDVPSPIDLRRPHDAETWVREADEKRPWREQFRVAIADALNAAVPPLRRVLEIGSGPGLLAERVLRSCSVDSYTLFDFSTPMLDFARKRVGGHPATTFVLGDFKDPCWPKALLAPFDVVVAMQAVHEIRHKRHVANLYHEVHGILRAEGVLLVCDHVPPDSSARMVALHSTEGEQHAALTTAGFLDVKTHLLLNGLYLCSGRKQQ